MALRYRNEHVINSSRSAYSLTHRDDSLSSNDDSEATPVPPEPNKSEAYLASLTMKLQSDAAAEAHSRSSQLTSRSDSFGVVSNDQRHTSTSDFEADESPDQGFKPGNQPHMNRSVSEHFGAIPGGAVLHATALSHANGDASLARRGVEEDHDDGHVSMGVDATQEHSFPKDFALDIDDESDFEDDSLRATQEIKHHRQTMSPAGKARANSRVSQKSVTSISTKSHNVFETPEVFAKRTDFMAAPEHSSSSQLTSQLSATQRDPREQYLEATTGSKSGQSTGSGLTMHLKHKAPIRIVVKNDCSAHLAIGFASSSANADIGDANMYNSRLAEDDGEPDEDFPALDRTRPIESYHVDEFALVKATESEFRDNSKRTPNKVSFKSRSSASSTPVPGAKSRSSPQPVAGDGGDNASQQSQRSRPSIIGMPGALPSNNPQGNGPAVKFSPMQAPTNSKQDASSGGFSGKSAGSSQFDKMGSRTSIQYATSFGDSRNDFIVVKVYMHPFDPILSRPFWADEMVQKQTKVSEVFEQMCREKMMDAEMYVSRTTEKSANPPQAPPSPQSPKSQSQAPAKTSQQKALNMNAAVQRYISKGAPKNILTASVGPNVTSGGQEEETPSVIFELIPRRHLQGAQNSVRKSTSQTLSHAASSPTDKANSSNIKKKPSSDLQNAVLAMQPLGFYKYPVARRQQMNFLARSERELVIDGEYVHIMPPTDWSLLDQPKTTTFHIRQVLRVKQSRKVPTNFSIVIMKATGPKRYDLESKDASTAAEIVDQSQRLKKANFKPII